MLLENQLQESRGSAPIKSPLAHSPTNDMAAECRSEYGAYRRRQGMLVYGVLDDDSLGGRLNVAFAGFEAKIQAANVAANEMKL